MFESELEQVRQEISRLLNLTTTTHEGILMRGCEIDGKHSRFPAQKQSSGLSQFFAMDHWMIDGNLLEPTT